MSSLNLLLDSAQNFERTHQILLYTLFGRSNLAQYLLQGSVIGSVEWEPERSLFDLAVNLDNGAKSWIELKMWAILTNDQLRRQLSYVQKRRDKAVYILLGLTSFEYSSAQISSLAGGVATKISYRELIDGLSKIAKQPDESADVQELAVAYRRILIAQQLEIENGYTGAPVKGNIKTYYYSLYRQIQNLLPQNLETWIYTVNNRGGPVYILNCRNWYKTKYLNVLTQVYFEIVNGVFCIKFFSDTTDNDMRRKIREQLRSDLMNLLEDSYTLKISGRVGKYMTAVQLDYDASDSRKINETAKIVEDLDLKLKGLGWMLDFQTIKI